METRECAGYRIIVTVPVNSRSEIVIGYRSTQPEPYACWWCTDKTSYDFGRYCVTYRQAADVLADRLKATKDSIEKDIAVYL